jgi:Zn finger protein HypA/HybF involved in hydrogenase expression
MKTKFKCRRCEYKFEVDGDIMQAMCPKCKRNVSLLNQPLKPGDVIHRGGFK